MNLSDEEKSIFLEEIEKIEKKKVEAPKPTKKPRKKMSAIALFATTFLLFLVVVVFLIFVLSIGGPGNPILQFFGQNEDSVKDFLLSLVNGSFGFLSVILLMAIAIGFFLGFSTKKEESKKRRTTLLFAIVSIILQFFTALVWIGMYRFVDAIAVTPGSEGGEILMILPDGTTLVPPISAEETEHLTIPINLDFSLEKIEKSIKSRGGEIDNISWDFGGSGVFDTPSTARERSQRLVRTGRHDVSVKIILTNGNEIIKKISFEIPEGTFFAKPENGSAPLDVELDATMIATPIIGAEKFEWDFDGDFVADEVSTNPVILAHFEKIGKYQIHLNIVDRGGQVYKFSREIVVSEPSEDFLIPRIITAPPLKDNILEIEKGRTVHFDASDSLSTKGKIVSYEWRISDGTKQSGESFSKKFTEEGEFEIRLSLTDSGGNERQKVIPIKVIGERSAPIIVLRSDPRAEDGKIRGSVPLTVLLNAEDSLDADNNIISYEWDFDADGKPEKTGSEIEYTFREEGRFEVILTVTDTDDNRVSESLFFELGGEKLTAQITADPETAEMPCEIDFDGSLSQCSSDDCSISAYEWDFGDGIGKQLAGAHLPHRFGRIGKFTVRLTVFASSGESATTTKDIFCRETPVSACFTTSRTRGSAPMTVSFDPSCSTGTIQKWSWDFGDGSFSESVSPTHIFQRSGRHTTILTVEDNKRNIARYSLELFAE